MSNIWDERGRDEACARLATEMAGYALGVSPGEITGLDRGGPAVTSARQLAMYLCHVAFELSLGRVALAFGRDRSTVSHACHVIEDRRDEPGYDAWIGSLETALRETPAPRARSAS